MSEARQEPNAAGTEAPQASKKMSLAEAAKQMLAQKKAQATGKVKPHHSVGGGNQTMKSQLTKKPNNQRKRMGV